MTDHDDSRVRKALQGADFPSSREELVAYASERDELDHQTRTALNGLPARTYRSLDEVVDAVPARPGTTANR